MTDKAAYNSYDEVSYAGYAYSQIHPNHLATLATLSGMSPPPVERCRVLEWGCAGGGNLIPMAYGYSSQLMELHVHLPRFTLKIGQRPVASAVARFQAGRGSSKVTSMRHDRVNLTPFDRHVLQHLDGNHDRAGLTNILTELVRTGELQP